LSKPATGSPVVWLLCPSVTRRQANAAVLSIRGKSGSMPDTHKRHLGIRAIIVFYREFERATRDADISIGQYRTMLFLKGGAKRAGAIAAAGAVKKPTVSAMLANLREKGWITDEADPDDARALSVALTPAGLARLNALED